MTHEEYWRKLAADIAGEQKAAPQSEPKRPDGSYEKDDRIYNSRGELIEIFEDRWRVVKDGGRSGWWRFNQHYDRNGYCDNPGRGY